MKLGFIRNFTTRHGNRELGFVMPDLKTLPPHFSVTNVSKVSKKTIDQKGKWTEKNFISIQLWHGDDFNHRAKMEDLDIFLNKIENCCDEWNVQVELDTDTVGSYNIDEIIIYHNSQNISFQLSRTHTKPASSDES